MSLFTLLKINTCSGNNPVNDSAAQEYRRWETGNLRLIARSSR